LVPLTLAVALAVNVAPSTIVKVAPVAGAVTVILFTVVAVATPSVGVTSVGLVDITKVVPVPVCAAIEVAFPDDVIGPVNEAFVVTVAAFPVIDPDGTT